MAFNASAVFAYSVLQLTGNNVKYTTDGYKVALYGNGVTLNNTATLGTDTEWGGSGTGTWNTSNNNEVTGTGYTTGGASVTPTSVSQVSNVIKFTSSGTPQWTVATFTAYGGLVYDVTVSNQGLCYNQFGGAQQVTAGTSMGVAA